MENDRVEFPEPFCAPAPITLEQYCAYTPEKLELVRGYLIAGPESPEGRIDLLAVLLRNCGLEVAVRLADPAEWREALERQFLSW
jgi:hypothetical protein